MKLMKLQIQYWAIWLAAQIQIVGADFDPEVLQWPGGSLIAPLLWLYATIASAWSLARHENPQQYVQQ